MRVVIDPGHGGRDPGAIGRLREYPVRETDLAWTVSVLAGSHLRAAGVEVLYTRDHGQWVALEARAALANRQRADGFVSIHFNSAESTLATGIEVLHYGSRLGRALAEMIRASLFDDDALFGYPLPDRGLKERPGLAVLRMTRMPAVMVELPFMRTPNNLQFCVRAESQQLFARAIADGVLLWLRTHRILERDGRTD